MQPMMTTVLDLDSALGGNAGLLLGGGLGLYLKQEHLRAARIRTLLPPERMPVARTTQDIDLFIRTEVITRRDRVTEFQQALNTLGFKVLEEAKWMKFERAISGTTVVLDLMTGPIEGAEHTVETRGIRIKPKGVSEFHARATADAVGIEHAPVSVSLTGARSDGTQHTCDVLVPGPFSYTLMKLGALQDRIADTNKDAGRHHALDLYRIAAMLTEQDAAVAAGLAAAHARNPIVSARLNSIDELFGSPTTLGSIRLREHPLCPPDADIAWLANELRTLLRPG